MKNKKLLLIPALFLVMILSVNAYTVLSDFSKVWSTTNTSRIVDIAYQSNIDYTEDYVYNDEKIYYKNMTYYTSITNNTGFYWLVEDSPDYYTFSPYLLTSSTYLRKYDAETGEQLNDTSTGLVTDEAQLSKRNYALTMYEPPRYIYATSNHPSRVGVLKLYYPSTTSLDCTVTASLYTGGSESNLLVAYDSNYFYIMDSYNGLGLNMYDYDCNRIYNNPSILTTIGLNTTHLRNSRDYMINRNTNYIYGLYPKNYATLTNYTLFSFTNLGYFGDDLNLNSYFNMTVNISDSVAGGNIYYDFDDMYAFVLFYNGSNTSDVFLGQIKLTSSGGISDDADDGHLYALRDYINTVGFDVYQYNANVELFDIDGDIYLQLYDTVGSTYDLWTIGGSETNETPGLDCNSDFTYCIDEDSICFPNNELYPGINSSNYLCTYALLGDDLSIGCYDGNVTYCSGGCVNLEYTNAFGIEYLHGVCSNTSTCSNDCTVEGYTYSDSFVSYKQCGFYDSDTCLDWSASIPCPEGEYSVDGFCDSLNTTTDVYYTLTSYSIEPELEYMSEISYTSNPPYIYLKTPLIYIDEGFTYYAGNTWTWIYTMLNCNYTESQVYKQDTPATINTSATHTFNGYSNGVTTLKVKPSYNNTVTLAGYDVADQLIYNYTVEDNTTLGTCLYRDGSLVGCQNYLYADVNNVELSVQTLKPYTSTYTHSVKMQVNLNNGGKQSVYTGFTPSNTTPTGTYYKAIITSTNTSYYYLIVTNGEQGNNAWKNTTVGEEYTGSTRVYDQSCYYTDVGCYNTRHYMTRNTSQGLWNVKDFKVCVNTLGDTTIPTGDTGGDAFSDMSNKMKLLIAILGTLIVFALCILVGVTYDMTKVMAFAGTFLSVGLLIYFAIIGWIPVWIIIVMILTSAMVVMIFFRNTFTGSNSGG